MRNRLKKVLVLLIIFSVILSFNVITKADDEVNEIVEEIEEEIVEDDEDTDEEVDENEEADEDEEVDEDEEADEDEDEDEETTVGVYSNNCFALYSEDTTISTIIDGDAFIISSGKVTFTTVISGNLFIIASEVELDTSAQVYGSIYAIADTMYFDGLTYGNIYTLADTLTIGDNAYIYQDVNAYATSSIEIAGIIGRNVSVNSTEINLLSTAYIYGDFSYSTENELSSDDTDELIVGDINYKTTANEESTFDTVTYYVEYFVTFIVFAIVIYLIGKFIKARFIEESKKLDKNIVWIILYGIFGILLTPILAIILLLLGVTSYVALLALVLYMLAIVMGPTMLVLTISEFCSEKTKESMPQNDLLRTICFIIIFGFIFRLLELIPSWGGLAVSIIAIVLGVGILIKNIIPNKNKENIE